MGSQAGGDLVTLVDVLRSQAEDRGEQTVYTFLADGEEPSRTLTYCQLDREARALAARLARWVPPGERALLLFPPGLSFLSSFFACLYAGVVAVPAYPPEPRRLEASLTRLEAVVADARATLVLGPPGLISSLGGLPRLPEALGQARWLEVGEESEASVSQEARAWRQPELRAGDLAFLQYTSGSTGDPKGVALSHENLIHNQQVIQQAMGTGPQTVMASWLPLYHDMGLIGAALQPLYCGGSAVLMPPMAFLQRPARWLRAISHFRATLAGGPNFGYELCVEKISPEARDGLDLSNWEVAFNGAEPVRAGTLERFAAAFAPHGFRPGSWSPCYGLAESSLLVTSVVCGAEPSVTACDPEALEKGEVRASRWDEARRAVSCGPPGRGLEVRITDPASGSLCREGVVGEIRVAGRSVSRGYWNRAELSREIFDTPIPGEESGEAFLHTGDLGFLFGGELYVTGRIKELIILRGRNLYPQDVETVVQGAHEDLRRGAGIAFGLDVDGEERLVVVQVVEPRARDLGAQITLAVRQAVSESFQVPLYGLYLVRGNSVPKTSSGKPRRTRCRQLLLDGELSIIHGWTKDGRQLTPVPVE